MDGHFSFLTQCFLRGIIEVKSIFLLIHMNKDSLKLNRVKTLDKGTGFANQHSTV